MIYTHIDAKINPFVAGWSLQSCCRQAVNTTSAPSALETYAADKPLHKSHGSTDSVIWAVRTSSFLPKRQRLFHRRASHRPAVR